MRPASPGPGRGAGARAAITAAGQRAQPAAVHTPLSLKRVAARALLRPPLPPRGPARFCWPALGASGPAGEGGRCPGCTRCLPARGGESAPAPSMCAVFQLVGHSSRVNQFLEQSLSYLWSPQEPLQEVAVRFIGEPRAPTLLCHAAARPQHRLLLAEPRACRAVPAQGRTGRSRASLLPSSSPACAAGGVGVLLGASEPPGVLRPRGQASGNGGGAVLGRWAGQWDL